MSKQAPNWQRAGQWPVWQKSLHNPNLAAFARLCGGHSIRVTEWDRLTAGIDEALNYAGPALVKTVTDAELI